MEIQVISLHFSNLFRKNDANESHEAQTDQAAGLFFRWLWNESNTEIYAEYHFNDSKVDLRDLLLDSRHARAFTIGLQKYFSKNSIKFNFELDSNGANWRETIKECWVVV